MALRSKIQNVTAATVDVTKQACGMVTHRTQQFVGWTLQGLVIGAFAMAKYSLEYIDQLTEEGEEDGSVSGSSDGSMTGSSGDDDGSRSESSASESESELESDAESDAEAEKGGAEGEVRKGKAARADDDAGGAPRRGAPWAPHGPPSWTPPMDPPMDTPPWS